MNHRILTAALLAALTLPLAANAQTAPQTTGASGNIAFCTAIDPTTNAAVPCAPNSGGSQATGANSIAIGQATASGNTSQASGFAARASGDYSIASGENASATGSFSIATGSFAAASGSGSIATGEMSQALDGGDIAVGVSALAGTGTGAGGNVSIGENSWAVGGNAVTLGSYAQGRGAGSVLIGANATDTLSSNSSLPPDPTTGVHPGSTGNYVVALGLGAVAAGDNAVAINGQALMPSGVAIAGTAEQTGGVAIGGGAVAWTDYALANGAYSSAEGAYSVAIGPWATAQGDYSVAVGEGSVANRIATVSVGNDGSNGQPAFQRSIANVAAGVYPFDAVNLSQLNTGGSAVASWIGAGASFNAAGGGAFTAPSFVLTNPYSAGTYNTVADALAALDTAVTDVSKQPGPQGPTGSTGPAGPQGPQGATGATGPTGRQGPAGPAGTNGKNGTNGSGTTADPLAVRYDDATDAGVTLHGAGGTQVRNVAAGTAPTDAANVSQINEALQSAKTYTDIRSADTLNQANAYTDMQVGRLNLRVNYALAAAAANANAAAAVAAQDPSHRNRVAVSDGLASGVNAWTAMYQHKGDSGVTWNVSLTGEQGGGSSSERQVGVGVGYSW